MRRTKTKGENCGGTGGSFHNEVIARLGGLGVENSRLMILLIIYYVNSIYGTRFREMAQFIRMVRQEKENKGVEFSGVMDRLEG